MNKLKKEKEKPFVPVVPRPTPDARSRLSALGYKILELPIRSRDTIRGYKVVVSGKGRTMSVEAKTADEGVTMLGKMLGVIAR
jgi:hypothetical protein